MKKVTQDALLVIFIIEIYLVITLFYEMDFSSINGDLFILLSILFTGSVLAYLFGQLFSLYSSLIFVAGYGTYLLYLSLIDINIELASFVLIIISPIIIFTMGSYSSYTKRLKLRVSELEEKMHKYVTVDPVTGLENITAFNMDLQRQMAFAKRYDINLYLMIIELKYFDELKALYKQTGIDEISNQLSKMMTQATRLEDNKYRLSNNLYAIILENVKDDGIEVVKRKLKDNINEALVNKLNGGQDVIHVEVRLGYIKYSNSFKSSSEFYSMAKKELVYDV